MNLFWDLYWVPVGHNRGQRHICYENENKFNVP